MESAAAKVGQTMQKKKIKGRPASRKEDVHASLVCRDINKDLITAVMASKCSKTIHTLIRWIQIAQVILSLEKGSCTAETFAKEAE